MIFEEYWEENQSKFKIQGEDYFHADIDHVAKEVWKAALESIRGKIVSVDMSTSEEDSYNRVYAKITAFNDSETLLADFEESNFDLKQDKKMKEWKPIKDAPKDGTPVIGININHININIKSISYRAYSPYAEGKLEWRDCQGTKFQATHWVPLGFLPELSKLLKS